MNIKEAFKKYYEKLIVEAVIKSVILGLAAGLLVGGLFTALALMFGFNGLWTVWTSVALGVITAGVAGALLYVYNFKPSFREAASRVDQTGSGLEERMITMLELEGNDTLIAQKQREDGQTKIAGVTPKMMRYKFPLYAFIAVGLAAIFGLSILPYGAAIAINDAKIKETEKTLQADEDAIIAKMIAALKNTVVGSAVSKELKDELLGYIAELEVKVGAAKTHLEKVDYIREAAEKIRLAILNYIDAIKNDPEIDPDEKDKLIGDGENLWKDIETIIDGGLVDIGEGPTVPGPAQPVAPQPGQPNPGQEETDIGEKTPEPASPAGAPDAENADYAGENIIDGNTPYTDDMEQWEKEYQEMLNNPNLTDAEREAAENYYNQMKKEQAA